MAIELFSKEELGAHSHPDLGWTTHPALTLKKASLCQTPCPKKPSEILGFRTRFHAHEPQELNMSLLSVWPSMTGQGGCNDCLM